MDGSAKFVGNTSYATFNITVRNPQFSRSLNNIGIIVTAYGDLVTMVALIAPENAVNKYCFAMIRAGQSAASSVLVIFRIMRDVVGDCAVGDSRLCRPIGDNTATLDNRRVFRDQTVIK